MTTRKTYLYRLDVTYPPGSLEWGWEPENWDPGYSANPESDDTFRWPRNPLYMSASGARRRAQLFRKYGAAVAVVRSLPVEWPAVEASMGAPEAGETP